MKRALIVALIFGVGGVALGAGYIAYKPHLDERRVLELEQAVNDAARNHQYDYIWDYMHPDDQSYWGSKEKYTDLLKRRDDITGRFVSTKSITVLSNVRELPRWVSPVTKKSYEEVYEVPVEYVTLQDGKEQIARDLEYVQLVRGDARYFTLVPKDELEQRLKQADALLKP